MKLIRTMDSGVSISHGSACWMARVLESIDSFKILESRVGVISGDKMLAGVDVDAFIADVWASVGLSGYMALNLMLVSGRVVKIDSLTDAAGCQVLSVRHDETTFPSGLTGRWVDSLIVQKPKRSKAVA